MNKVGRPSVKMKSGSASKGKSAGGFKGRLTKMASRIRGGFSRVKPSKDVLKSSEKVSKGAANKPSGGGISKINQLTGANWTKKE